MKWFILFISCSLSFTIAKANCLSGDCKEGEGTYLFKSGNKYIGHFDNGYPSGKGIMYYFNGDKYLGTWLNGHKHGKGKYLFNSGNVYIGQFSHDVIEGYGQMTYPEGDFYDGMWHRDVRHGQGRYEYENGALYTGEFEEGMFHGKGKFIEANGATLSGEWEHHKLISKKISNISEEEPMKMAFSGFQESSKISVSKEKIRKQKFKNCNNELCNEEQGIYEYLDGSRYIGYFIDGKPEGQGTCHYISGNKYIGEWSDNAPHGKGVMHYNTGVVYGAHWEMGKPIKLLNSKEKYKIAADILVDRDEEVKIWAVVIGVSKYQHMPTLNYSDDDAYRMYAFLKSPEGGALPDEQIQILIDEDATRDKILEIMQHTFYKADENDMVIMYFSGHGLQGNFLPIDYDGYNNKIRHEEINEILSHSKAKYKVCYADACYSGSMTAMKSADMDEQLRQYYTELDRSHQGVAFMLSSKGVEYSLEDGGLRQGVFSHFLIRGLKGEANINNDRFVTINELFKYVNFKVRKYTGNVQNPMIKGNFDNKMPVSIIRNQK